MKSPIHGSGNKIPKRVALLFLVVLLYVTSNTGIVLIFCVPLLALAFGVLVGGLFTIRWTNKAFSIMRTLLVVAAVDAILSLGVYAVGYYE